MKLLLVEDDKSLGRILSERLAEKSYQVTWAESLFQAKQSFDSTVELAILDVNLPDGSGFDLAQWIKQRSAVPLIFLTAMNTAENRLLGYEIGAEEYIPKPFHFRELLLRIEHVRQNHVAEEVVACPVGSIHLRDRAILGRDGEALKVASKDFDVLRFLIERAPAVVSRDEILDQVWGAEKFPSSRTIDNTIVRIRQAIGDENSEYIRSVRGVGYQWVGGKQE